MCSGRNQNVVLDLSGADIVAFTSSSNSAGKEFKNPRRSAKAASFHRDRHQECDVAPSGSIWIFNVDRATRSSRFRLRVRGLAVGVAQA